MYAALGSTSLATGVVSYCIAEQLNEVLCSLAHCVVNVEPLLAKEEEVLNINFPQVLSRVDTTAYGHLRGGREGGGTE